MEVIDVEELFEEGFDAEVVCAWVEVVVGEVEGEDFGRLRWVGLGNWYEGGDGGENKYRGGH